MTNWDKARRVRKEIRTNRKIMLDVRCGKKPDSDLIARALDLTQEACDLDMKISKTTESITKMDNKTLRCFCLQLQKQIREAILKKVFAAIKGAKSRGEKISVDPYKMSNEKLRELLQTLGK